jgi:peptidoglycan biosynthesis protein MviN/MurJ (putative lipid II flippase)
MVTERYGPLLASRLIALCGFPLAYLLLPSLGTTGVAVGIGLARMGAAVLTFFLARRALGLALPRAFSARVVLASGFFAVFLIPLLLALRRPPLLRGPLATLHALAPLLGVAALGAALYLLALRLLGGLAEPDRRRLLDLPIPFKGVLRRIL